MQIEQRVRDHVDAGGVRTYYEIVGEGEPVVMLHGGMCALETWGPQIPALAAKHRLYLPERRGHGRTPDVPGPVTYPMMAADTIAFMEAMRLESAHVVGWSDGAMIALLVAMQRPDLVKKLVYISNPIHPAETRPKYAAMLKHLTPQHLPPFLRQGYAAVSPDGAAHFDVVAAKMIAMWQADPGVSFEQLREVKTPTLILLGDDDLQSPAHAGAMQDALSSAQVAVVPGASHALAMEKPELVNRMILDFLAPAQTEKRFGGG